MQEREAFAEATFCIDMSNDTYSGYTDGVSWNGYACPYFTFDQAVRVLDSLGLKWEYHEVGGYFSVRNAADPDDYEPEKFEAVEIGVNGEKIEAYAIGAYSWTWGYCD